MIDAADGAAASRPRAGYPQTMTVAAQTAQLIRLLMRSRLLTVSGPRGSGKRQLAERVGSEVHDNFPDGVWVLDVASAGDPAAIGTALASVIGVPVRRRRDAAETAETIAAHLCHDCFLLILLNADRHAGRVGALATRMLNACRAGQVLVTAERPLGVVGEVVWDLSLANNKEPDYASGDLQPTPLPSPERPSGWSLMT